MSVKVMSLVWEQATVGGSELLVLLALADYADDEAKELARLKRELAAAEMVHWRKTRGAEG